MTVSAGSGVSRGDGLTYRNIGGADVADDALGDYLTQEDGTSRFTLEDGTGSLIRE